MFDKYRTIIFKNNGEIVFYPKDSNMSNIAIIDSFLNDEKIEDAPSYLTISSLGHATLVNNEEGAYTLYLPKVFSKDLYEKLLILLYASDGFKLLGVNQYFEEKILDENIQDNLASIISHYAHDLTD